MYETVGQTDRQRSPVPQTCTHELTPLSSLRGLTLTSSNNLATFFHFRPIKNSIINFFSSFFFFF